MKTPGKLLRRLGLATALLAAAFGCSETTPDKVLADARDVAADARTLAVDANARVTAADAHVKAAVADARVDALANRRTENLPRTRVLIPSGTILKVFLIDALDSETSSSGDRFLASLAESVVIDGVTRLPKGTMVRGRVIDAQRAGKVQGRSFLHLDLTEIVQGNNRVAITTTTFEETADSTQTRDAEVIAGGAGVGAIIGAIAGGKKGAAIGAAVGGGAGTGVVLGTRGREIHYDPETRLDFTLTSPVGL